MQLNVFIVTRNAIIAIAKGGDLFAAALSAEEVEPAEEVVEEADQLRRCLVRAHLREADNVGKQNTEKKFRKL